MSNETAKQDMIEMFSSLTGTEPEFARSFLEGSGWNVDAATQAFFGGDSSMLSGASAATRPTHPPAAPIGGSSSGAAVQSLAEEYGVDEATAAAIAAAQGPDPSGVRAPIPVKRQRLFDTPGAAGGGGGANLPRELRAAMRNFEAEERRAMHGMMRGASNGSLGSRSGDPDQQLFQPPVDLLYGDNFASARKLGKREHRWILMNIQNYDEFFSHVLNRDLWSDSMTKELIRGTFVFMQLDCNSSEGQNFVRLYRPPQPFPCVAIVDPRTGEMLTVLRLTSTLTPDGLRERFLEEVTSFLDKNSMEPGAPPPVARPFETGPATVNIGSASESDQLAAAIAASLQQTSVSSAPSTSEIDSITEARALANRRVASSSRKPSKGNRGSSVENAMVLVDSDDEEYEYVDDDDDVDDVEFADAVSADTPRAEQEKVVKAPAVVVEDEPAADEPDCTSITVRLSSGPRLKRRFRTSNTIAQLFATVLSLDEGISEGGFDLVMYPNVSLRAMDQQSTLADAKVLNTSLMIKSL